ERAHAIDQVVAVFGPVAAGGLVSNMVSHDRRARREDGDVGTTLTLQFELSAFKAFANLIVSDVERAFGRNVRGILEAGNLAFPVVLQRLRCCCVVSVTVDDHSRKMIPELSR